MHPIDAYIHAFELYKSKRGKDAADTLAVALGGEEATSPILDSLDKIFDEDTLIHAAILNTIVSEAKTPK